MDLKKLATKPNLEKITLDQQTIVDLYGEPLEFYMYDRQDLPTYLRLAQLKDDQFEMFELIKHLILDEQGKAVLQDGEMLPVDVMVKVLEAAIQKLGNAQPQTLAS